MHEVADVRRALAADPLDLRRLEATGRTAGDGAQPGIDRARSRRRRWRSRASFDLVEGRTSAAAPPWNRTRPFAPRRRARSGPSCAPGRGRLRGRAWPHLVEAALELFPPPALRGAPRDPPRAPPSRVRVDRGQRRGAGRRRGCTSRCRASRGQRAGGRLEDSAPGLLLAADVEKFARHPFRGGPGAGVLALRATVLERVRGRLAPLFAAPHCWRVSPCPRGSRNRRTSCCARSRAPSGASRGRRSRCRRRGSLREVRSRRVARGGAAHRGSTRADAGGRRRGVRRWRESRSSPLPEPSPDRVGR